MLRQLAEEDDDAKPPVAETRQLAVAMQADPWPGSPPWLSEQSLGHAGTWRPASLVVWPYELHGVSSGSVECPGDVHFHLRGTDHPQRHRGEIMDLVTVLQLCAEMDLHGCIEQMSG